VGYPFDTVKVKLQTSTSPFSGGAVGCLRHILREEGAKGLYRGMAGPLFFSTPRFALTFQGNALGLKLLGHDPSSRSRPSYGQVFAGGAFSQLAVVPLVTAPCERIKVLLQTQPNNPQGQLECLKKVLDSHGLARGVMRGTVLTYARDVPSFATYFLVYEFFRNRFLNPEKDSGSALHNVQEGVLGMGVTGTLLSGAAAGFVGWIVAIPFDTLKNRHQAVMTGSIGTTVTDLLTRDGHAGLWRGAVPILIRAMPTNAAAFLGYEVVISMLTCLPNT